jgi:hypothetical protein
MRDETREAEVLQIARGGPARAHAEVPAADEDIAGPHQIAPAGAIRAEDVFELLLRREVEGGIRQDQVGVDVVAELPDSGFEFHVAPFRSFTAKTLRRKEGAKISYWQSNPLNGAIASLRVFAVTRFLLIFFASSRLRGKALRSYPSSGTRGDR